MRWNPLSRSDPSEAEGDGDPDDPNTADSSSSDANNADPNRHRPIMQPARRRNRKRCIIEAGIVAACAIALVVGLSVHYGQQPAAVSADLWSDEPVEAIEPAQQKNDDNSIEPDFNFKEPPGHDHDHDHDDHGKENTSDAGSPMPGMDEPASNFRPGIIAGEQDVVDCSNYQNHVELSKKPPVSMSYVLWVPDGEVNMGTLSARITYGGNGWIGFAYSTRGQMIGSRSVIGLPGEPNGLGNPGKYDLNSHDATAGVVPMKDEFQTLVNATIAQEDGVTTLTFTKPLSESSSGEEEEDGGEVRLIPNTTATFLWAVGTSNDLNYHTFTNKGSFELFLEPCISIAQDVEAPEVVTIWPSFNVSNMSAEDLLRGEEIRTALNAYTPTHVLDDPATPQHRAYRWLSYEDPRRLTESNATFRQRYVLATLFYSNPGGSSNGTGTLLSDWLRGSSECAWSGVTCGDEFVEKDDGTFGVFLDEGTGRLSDATGGSKDEDGISSPDAYEERGNTSTKDTNQTRDINGTMGNYDVWGDEQPVVAIDLGGLGLGGILPDEVGALISLKSFNLSFNDLEGTMPFTFGLLENLVTLRLNNNRLEGPIPGTIGGLKALEELSVHNNLFSGPIPQALGGLTALKVARLNNNSLDGNIPESIGGLIELRELEFGYNNLSGEVPLPICNLALADFGVDYQHSLPKVECSCCVGGDEEPPSSLAPPPSEANATDIGAEP